MNIEMFSMMVKSLNPQISFKFLHMIIRLQPRYGAYELQLVVREHHAEPPEEDLEHVHEAEVEVYFSQYEPKNQLKVNCTDTIPISCCS